MKMLVTGAKGQLGCELRRCLGTMRAEIGPIPEAYAGAEVDYVDLAELDVSDGRAVSAWFAGHAYDLVLNCAAYTNVDGCEAREADAFRANALGPMHLARACAAQGAKLVHVSTDYVFAGNGERPRTEDDPVRPVSAYGRTKWAGEVLAADANPRTFVVRTAWLYGYEGRNFVRTMLRLGAERGSVDVVADQLGNPTSANDLAHEVLRLALTDGYGTYHVTNDGTCSWADLAARVMQRAGLACEVVPVTSADWKHAHPESADRPAFSALDNARLRATIGDRMRPWQDALDCFLGNLGVRG